MAAKEKACRTCHIITKKQKCPKCQGKLSEDYSGICFILRPDKSQLAKKLSIEKPGKYAFRVR